MHPVFFTQTLRKPPFPLPGNALVGMNPAAFGYVAEMPGRDGAVGGGPKGKL
jgi:hypothetical protein